MRILELKIPPVALALITAGMMWLSASALPFLDIRWEQNSTVAIIFFVVGGMVAGAGVLTFRRADTTVNPMSPDSASALVVQGIYLFSRNPMYLGLALALLGLCIYLSNLSTVLFLAAFILYMNRFQIRPEERVLEKLFAKEFRSYKNQVRRWL